MCIKLTLQPKLRDQGLPDHPRHRFVSQNACAMQEMNTNTFRKLVCSETKTDHLIDLLRKGGQTLIDCAYPSISGLCCQGGLHIMVDFLEGIEHEAWINAAEGGLKAPGRCLCNESSAVSS